MTLPVAAPPGSVVTAAQGAWSSSTRLATAAFTGDGFTAAIPASAVGCTVDHSCITGTYSWSLALHDPAIQENSTDALGPCAALGPDVSAVSGCAAFGATARRLATATGELPVVDDSVTACLTEPSLGTSSLRVTAGGARGSLDDGSLHVRGTPRQAVAAEISSPRGPLPAVRATRMVLTDRTGVADLGPERRRLPAARRRRCDRWPERRRRGLGAAGVPLPPVRDCRGGPADGNGECRCPRTRRTPTGRWCRFATRDRVGLRRVHGRPRRSVPRRSHRGQRGRPGHSRRDDPHPDRRRDLARHHRCRRPAAGPLRSGRERDRRACGLGRVLGRATCQARWVARVSRWPSIAFRTVLSASRRPPSAGRA